jgi:hypothetical protein
MDTVLSDPPLQQWFADTARETEVIAEEEVGQT